MSYELISKCNNPGNIDSFFRQDMFASGEARDIHGQMLQHYNLRRSASRTYALLLGRTCTSLNPISASEFYRFYLFRCTIHHIHTVHTLVTLPWRVAAPLSHPRRTREAPPRGSPPHPRR